MKIVNYRRFTTFVIIPLIIVIVVLLHLLIKNNEVEYKYEISEYKVGKGDTMWSIAEEYRNEHEYILDYIDRLIEINGTCDLYEGETIKILVDKGGINNE